MINVNEAVIARYSKHGKTFEILVDCDKALDFKEGKNVPLEEVLATTSIFSDVKQDEKPTNDDLNHVFGTLEPEEIAKKIIKEGEIQITTEHKHKLREEKRKQIINIIHRNAINPQTGHPHPPQRIESVMAEAQIKIDEFKPANLQVQAIVKSLAAYLPIKFEIWEVAVKMPSNYAAKSYHILKEFGKLLKDEWQDNGSLIAVVELPAGLQEEFENSIYKLSQGEAEIKVVNKR
ncbi:MAG: ribosome assembly factor SBDS [Nanoarchaeota archaeon]|nr:ribosome assembly factor SBDS [Nanoarchaeota archaeon]